MRSILMLLVLAACAPATRAAEAAPAEAPAAFPDRLHRLETLARVWGSVRYLHPWIGRADLDWDGALVRAIPAVESAQTPAQMRQAVGTMLAVLGDPASGVRDASAAAAATARPDTPAQPAPIRREGEVLRLDLGRLAARVDAGTASVDAALQPLSALAPGARAWVVDTRSGRDPATDGGSDKLIAALVARHLAAPLALGSHRYRRYDGYPTQTGSMSSGGYIAGTLTDAPTLAAGGGSLALPPLVLVTDRSTGLSGTWTAGLLAAGRTRLVADGDPLAQAAGTFEVPVLPGMVARIRTTELVAPTGATHFDADGQFSGDDAEAAIAAALTRIGQPPPPSSTGPRVPVPDADRPYADDKLPSRELRLLGLFRFWNVIEHFYPYRALIGPGWDDVLVRYIPQFDGNRDAADYQLTVRKLAAELHDSHAGVRSPMPESANRIGRHQPPIAVDWIEGRSVVVALLREGTGLQVGESVLAIDGEPVAARRQAFGQYFSASTPQAWQRDLHRSLLRGQAGSIARLQVRALDGRVREVALARVLGPDAPEWDAYDSRARPQPVFGLLDDGIAYVDLARLQRKDVDAMFAAIAPARAAIFDMRGYPNGTAWSVAPRLGRKLAPVGARFSRPAFDGLGAASGDLDTMSTQFAQHLPPASGPPYLGKVVMLVDASTQSQAEHTGLFFEAMTDVTFIGSATAGANGDVTEMVLPGGLRVSFSGHEVRHADGRPLQRVGITPDVAVAPTAAGLARGEDEVLAAARAWLQAHAGAATARP